MDGEALNSTAYVKLLSRYETIRMHGKQPSKLLAYNGVGGVSGSDKTGGIIKGTSTGNFLFIFIILSIH